MLVWWVTAVSPNGDIITTLYASEVDALGFIRHRYTVPEHIADNDVLSWLGANSSTRVAMDFDEV